MSRIKILFIAFLLSMSSFAGEIPTEIESEIPQNIQSIIKLLGKNVDIKKIRSLVGDPAKSKESKFYFEIKEYKYALVLTLENNVLKEVYYKFITPRVKLRSLKNLEKSYKKRKDNSHKSGYEFYYEKKGVELLFRGSSEPTLSSIKISRTHK